MGGLVGVVGTQEQRVWCVACGATVRRGGVCGVWCVVLQLGVVVCVVCVLQLGVVVCVVCDVCGV